MTAIEDIKREYGIEMAVVILCCRVFFETAHINDLITFVENNSVDWYSFVRIASLHRIRPTVYKIIHAVALPADIKVLIYKQQEEVTRKNWKHAIETERLILLLSQHNIQAIPYKGVAFSKQFFGDLTSRESSDIDLIIDPNDLEQAIVVLKQDEYLPELDDVYRYLGTRYYSYCKDYNLNKIKNGQREFHIELHWSIGAYNVGLDPKIDELLYKPCVQMDFVRANVKMLNGVSHFSATLIHHSVQDTFKYFKNIIDIAQGLKQPLIQQNAALLIDNFRSFNLKNALDISNALCDQLIGISSLSIQKTQASKHKISHFTDLLCSTQILPPEGMGNIIVWIKRRIPLQDSIVKKLKFYALSLKCRFVPSETDFKLIKFPKQFFFVYYLIKPFRSVIKPVNMIENKRKLLIQDNPI